MTNTRCYRIKDVSVSYKHLYLVSDDEKKTGYVFHYQPEKVTNKLTLINSSGKILINIRHISKIHPTFDIYSVDENDHQSLLGVLRRIGPLWHHKYIVESIYGEYNIDRVGRLFKHEYALMQDQQPVAQIKQEHLESNELALIEITDDADTKKDMFILSLVMILQTL